MLRFSIRFIFQAHLDVLNGELWGEEVSTTTTTTTSYYLQQSTSSNEVALNVILVLS